MYEENRFEHSPLTNRNYDLGFVEKKYDRSEHTSWFFNAQYSYRCNIKAIYWLLTWNQPKTAV